MRDSPGIPRRAVASWVLYDLANTIFSMGVISVFFSLWVRETVGAKRADTVYPVITAISMGIIFVASPLLGAMSDRVRKRMPFLVVSTLVCVACTSVLARWGFYTTVICFTIANIAYQAGLQFYDSLLPEVSTPENRGKVGGIGVGVGYLGSYLAVGLGFVLANYSASGTVDKPLYFSIVAGMFLLFALPCFVFVKERGNPRPRPIDRHMIVNSTRETLATLRSAHQYPGLLRFLIGRVFYTDPINTVISVMVLYTVNVALHDGIPPHAAEKTAQGIMMFAITFAVVGGFFWGWIADRIGPKRALTAVLICWMGIFVVCALIGILGLPLWVMHAVAASAGFSLGGVWAADRPLMLRLAPPSRVGEFYGLYGMVGRFSAVSGPLIWALTTSIAMRHFKLQPLMAQGIAVLFLLAMVVGSFLILRPVSDAARNWEEAPR